MGCAEAVAELTREGQRVAIVHGGGKTLSRTLQQLGIKSEFVDGLRVTDAATRDVALMVLAGLVNKSLSRRFRRREFQHLAFAVATEKCFAHAREKSVGAIWDLSAN